MEYGLVFCGGGGRGAYQAGVWKTLEKFGLARYVSAVSGTSVGALNAAMFCSVSVYKAERIWSELSQSDIADPVSAAGRVIGSIVNFAKSDDKTVNRGKIGSAFNSGLFSREGLTALIEENGINAAVTRSPIPCFACLHNTSWGEAEYFDMRAYPPDTVTRLLWASTAIPAAFAPVDIGGTLYRDGGLSDNTPVKPLYDIGLRRFIISYLSRDTIDKTKFPDAEFIELVPSEDIYLGEKNTNILNSGTLDFNGDNAKRRIALGESESAATLTILASAREKLTVTSNVKKQ